MRSRGSTLHATGAGARKSLVLFWSALFLCSMLLQYAAAPARVLAVHDDGVFELDGNALDSNAPGDDWENGTPGALDTLFIPGSVEKDGPDGTYFTTGGSKDENDLSSWKWSTNDVAPDKDELLDVFASVYGTGGDTVVYFGADKFDDSGDAQIGFWFFRNNVSLAAGGDFNGVHANGDVLVLSDFTNGGGVDRICVYEWTSGAGGTSAINNSAGCDTGGHLVLVASGADCVASGDGAYDVCADVNGANATAPWTFVNKDGSTDFGAGQFFEGGINLSTVFDGDPPCFNGFLAETRSSQETDAQLKDFALGSLDTCVPPDLSTEASVSTADFGGSVTDTATLSGSQGPVTGSIDFFFCKDPSGYPDCSSGGTKVGATKTISGGHATSDPLAIGVSAAAAGYYCFRAEYTPDAASDYLATKHTNQSSECFRVLPATIAISKSANPAGPVSAGDAIGFDITVTNNGSSTTLGINMSDPLPAGVDWAMDAPTGSTTGLACAITGAAGSQTLTCTKPSLAAGQSFSVHISGTTDAADCGVVSNSAHVATSNDGSGDSSANVTVRCPDVKVTKEPDQGDPGSSINAGDQAEFTINVENIGQGIARDVQVSDNLPDGIDWAVDDDRCSIAPDTGTTGQVLTCDLGDLAAGAAVLITLTGTTDKADCGTLDNTAAATSTNEGSNVLGNNSDDAAIEVKCASIDIQKVANPAGPVNAGDQIGFDVTVANNGTGDAYDVNATDTLPAGLGWSIESPVTGWSIVGGELRFHADTLAAGASSTVRIVADTDAADCGTVNNSATVTAANDGSDTDGDSVVIQCPDLEVVKTADPAGPVNAGDPIGFDVTIRNLGPGAAYDVSLTDVLPAGFSWSIETPVAGWAIANGELTFAAATLAAGATSTVTVVADTDAQACGVVPNTASATASNEPASALGNNQDGDSVTVQCPDITVDKTADNSPISAGDIASFTIVVTNLGPGTAYGVTLEDPLPAGVAWIDDSADCDIVAGTLACDFGTLPKDGYRTVHVSGETDAADCGTLPNLATVAATNEPSANTGNNQDGAQIDVDCADIELTKTADQASVDAGDQIGFTITVTNNGAGTAKGVHITDTLPTDAGLAWSIAPASAGWSISNGILSYGPADLATGASTSVHIVSGTTPETCGAVDNTATVTTTNDGSDTDGSTVMVECPDVTISKTADNSPILAGQTASFTISVWNLGPGLARDVQLHDVLPAGFAWTDDSDACEIVDGTLDCVIGDLATNAPIFTVHVSAPTSVEDCGTVPNLASVTAANEAAGNQGNNEDSDSIDVLCADISLVKTAGDAPDGDTLLLVEPGDVAFTYVVKNTGTATLIDIELVDDNATPGDPSDDVIVTCPQTTLAPGEEMTCTVTLPVSGYGLRTNIAVVTATPDIEPEEQVDAADDAIVNVPEPEVTPTPRITPPATSTIDGEQGSDTGSGMLLLLMLLGGVMLIAGYGFPAMARARARQTRR
jgi:uncharacterized repeat protein (TIGR01451 family)